MHHTEFRVVWSTFVVGQLGFWISFITFQALMARLTGSDGKWLGLLFFTNFIPMLVFTPFAGVIADRLERRRIMMVCYVLLTILMTVLAVLAFTENVTPTTLLPFAFGIGTIFSFNAPAGQAVVANSVPAADLTSAVSLQSAGANLSRVIGPTVAAPFLTLWNEGAAFAVYAITSVIVVWRLRRVKLSTYEPEQSTGSFWQRLRGGFDHARERPPALAALSVLCMSSLFAAGYLALLPVLSDQVFGRPRGFTTLAAVTGFGSMIGALTTGFREKEPTFASATLLVAGFGASLLLLGRMTDWLAANAVMVVVGAFYFSGMTSLNTLIQSLADENKRGRIMSLFVIGWAGLVPIGGLWQGSLAQTQGVRTTITVAGSVTAAYSLLALALVGRRRQTVRRWTVRSYDP